MAELQTLSTEEMSDKLLTHLVALARERGFGQPITIDAAKWAGRCWAMDHHEVFSLLSSLDLKKLIKRHPQEKGTTQVHLNVHPEADEYVRKKSMTRPATSTEPTPKSSTLIFVSHRSEEKDAAEKLVQLIEKSIEGIAPENIRCTSLAGHRVPFGEDFNPSLRQDLHSAKVVFVLLTKEALDSEWVWFEMGASWVLQKRTIVILGPKMKVPGHLPDPLKRHQAMAIDDQSVRAQLGDALKDAARAMGLSTRPSDGRITQALEDFVTSYRLIAEGTHHAGSRKIADMTTVEDVKVTDVEKVTDQGVLAEIAITHTDEMVREAAVRRLPDQLVLGKVARYDQDKDVRVAALEKLTDQDVIAKIAKSDQDPRVREAALGKLTDQGVVSEIAKTDRDEGVRQTAVRMLTNQPLLDQIAKIQDQVTFARLAKHQDSRVRMAAVKKLWDQTLLASIAMLDQDARVREAAVENITDRAILAEIAVSTRDEHLHAVARARLDKPEG